MSLRLAIASLIAVSALGQAFVTTNLVTRLPLPGGGFLTNVATIRLRQPQSQVASVTVDTNGVPAAPSDLVAWVPKNVLLRWNYPVEDTNVTFWVYRSANLTNWAAFHSFTYNVRAAVLPTSPDVRAFYTVAASNDAGQVFSRKIVR